MSVQGADLREICRMYVFASEEDFLQCEEFLFQHPSLAPIVEDSFRHLLTYFPGAIVRLEMRQIEALHEPSLVGIVESDLPLQLAARALRNFEQGAWWRQRDGECQGQFLFLTEEPDLPPAN